MSAVKLVKLKKIRALCFDARGLVAGELTDVKETGSELVSNQSFERPVFPKKTRVQLNLVVDDCESEQTVEARLSDYFRRGGTWVYRLKWKTIPELLRPKS